VAPACAVQADKHEAFVASLCATRPRIGDAARPVRLVLGKIDDYGLGSAEDFRHWMGRPGTDIASGRADGVVFVDMAYLEAAVLDRFYGSSVGVDFSVPISMFRRGQLTDYVNVMEAAARMVFEGRSLMEAATLLAEDVLTRLETYAQAFMRLSSLYADARWRIQNDTFLMELPARGISLTLRYWELRKSARETLETWKCWIESLLEDASSRPGETLRQTFAA
jgi:hypothetical protein